MLPRSIEALIERRPGAHLASLTLALLLVAGCSSTATREPAPAAPDEQPVAERGGARTETRARTDGDAIDDGEVRVVPDAALVSHERAVAAMAAGDWVEAELELEQLILGYPGFPGPYVNLAIVYRQDGRDDEAREVLEQAIALEPEHAAANNQLGMLLREAGEFEAAEAAYLRALAGDPAYALAYYNLGVLLDLYLARGSAALEAYRTYQSLQAEPDVEVGRWIIDLERRFGAGSGSDRVARETSQ